MRIGFWASCFTAKHPQSRVALSNDVKNAVNFIVGEFVFFAVLRFDEDPFARVDRNDRVIPVHSPCPLGVLPNLKDGE